MASYSHAGGFSLAAMQVAFHWQPPESIEDTLSTRGCLTHLRKQPQQKHTDELFAAIEWR